MVRFKKLGRVRKAAKRAMEAEKKPSEDEAQEALGRMLYALGV